MIYDFERCPTQKPHTWTTFLRKWRGFWYNYFAKISRLWIVTADMTSKKVSFGYDELNKRKRKRTVWKGYEPEIMEWYKLELLARGTMKNCIVLLKKRFSAHNNSGLFLLFVLCKSTNCGIEYKLVASQFPTPLFSTQIFNDTEFNQNLLAK